jgi:hypothetical protein
MTQSFLRHVREQLPQTRRQRPFPVQSRPVGVWRVARSQQATRAIIEKTLTTIIGKTLHLAVNVVLANLRGPHSEQGTDGAQERTSRKKEMAGNVRCFCSVHICPRILSGMTRESRTRRPPSTQSASPHFQPLAGPHTLSRFSPGSVPPMKTLSHTNCPLELALAH